MAGISTSLRLVDVMTAPIMNISNSLNSMVSQFADVQNAADVDVSSLTAMRNQVDMANAAAEQLNTAFQMVSDTIDANERGQEEFNNEINKGGSAADGLVKKLGAAVAAYASIQSIQKVIDLSDTMTNTTARLEMIVDDGGTVEELEAKIMNSANRARASYQTTADVISKLGMQAGKAFGSNDELIAFAEQLNKTFVIAGTDASGIESTMYNLTQALASGVLRGQDLNAVMSNAQPILQNVADYMGVGVERIREMAADGQLSADVLKNAMLAAAEETNARFEQMPITWGQLWITAKNQILDAFTPVIQTIGAGAQWIQDNWSTIAPIFYGVAAGALALAAGLAIQAAATWIATGAAAAFFATLLTNPLTYIVIAIGLIIGAIYKWVQAVGGIKIAWLMVVNAILTAWDWVKIGFFTGVYFVLDLWDKMSLGMQAAGTAIANFMGDMKANVLMILQNMVNGAINIINGFIGILNKIPGVNIGLIEQVSFGTEAQLANEAEKQARNQGLEDARAQVDAAIADRAGKLDAMKDDARAATADRLSEIEAAQIAAQNPETADSDPMGFTPYEDLLSTIADNTGATAGNTKNTWDMSEENLKYLKDMAEREAINRYTTVEIDMGGFTTNNNVNSEVDLDGIVNYIAETTEEALYSVFEGVHV
jgi:tape measure domain-containing protein